MTYDEIYRNAESVWGEQPDHALAELTPLLPKGKVLDLGMGEGRNAIFFAVNGFAVHGVDISPAAVEKCLTRAGELNIPIRAEAGDLLHVEIAPESCALITCAMSLQFVRKSESAALIERIRDGLVPGGMVYITTFSTEDPWLEHFRAHVAEVEPLTYHHPRMDTYVHFFDRSELTAAFESLRLHEISQGLYYDPGHPGVPQPHYHGILRYIGQKV